ncbi:MAG TPA: alpha/beta fold hydrolase [Anaerolineales bacterium]|nr:alpha/beta fold hydrolase [Anaerolineales bacterium]
MSAFIPWGSQPLAEWAEKYAHGKFIELDGLQTHYLEKGEGQPVILIHGFYFDNHMWDKNIDALAEHFKVYAIDLWGFGGSTREMLDYSYPLYARQLQLFMDALAIPRAHLVGQSMGGGTIVQFAINHPQRANKLVLVDPAVLPNKLPLMGKIANLPGVGEFLFGINTNFMRRLTLGNTFIYNKAIITDEFFDTVIRFQKVEGTTEILLDVLRRQFFHTLEAEARQLGEMELPVLITPGRHSAGVPIALSQRLHTILQGSQLEIFEQAGHCPNIESPDKFNHLALEFLTA